MIVDHGGHPVRIGLIKKDGGNEMIRKFYDGKVIMIGCRRRNWIKRLWIGFWRILKGERRKQPQDTPTLGG
jgi:hypothetical protein